MCSGAIFTLIFTAVMQNHGDR